MHKSFRSLRKFLGGQGSELFGAGLASGQHAIRAVHHGMAAGHESLPTVHPSHAGRAIEAWGLGIKACPSGTDGLRRVLQAMSQRPLRVRAGASRHPPSAGNP